MDSVAQGTDKDSWLLPILVVVLYLNMGTCNE